MTAMCMKVIYMLLLIAIRRRLVFSLNDTTATLTYLTKWVTETDVCRTALEFFSVQPSVLSPFFVTKFLDCICSSDSETVAYRHRGLQDILKALIASVIICYFIKLILEK